MDPSPSPDSVFERHPRVTMFVVFVVLFAAIDLAAGYLAGARERRFDANERTIRTATPYHHGLRPNMVVEGMIWGPLTYRMATNSLGFKDGEPREVSLATERHRIVLIGDSFTEGIGYPHEQTYAGRIEAALRDRNIEVLNAGVIGYSPLIYQQKIRYYLEEVGLEFDELIVFLDISDVENDAVRYRTTPEGGIRHTPEHRADQTDRGSIVDRVRDFVADRMFLTYTVLNAIQDMISPPPRGEINRSRAAWTFDEAAFSDYGERGLRLNTEHMNGLLEALREHGVELTVVVYPWPDQIVQEDLESLHVRHWRDWTAANGAGFVDLYPRFIDGRDWEDVVDTYYIGQGDVHFNEVGHAYIAEGFLEHYLARTRGDQSS